jgi:putative glycosyltransferase (TIGR04372 family)
LDQSPSRVLDTSWYLAVGHIALLDSYIKAMQLGWHPERELWLLRVPGQKIPNQAYLDCWRAYLSVPEPGPNGSNRDEISRDTGIPGTSLPFVTDFFWANKDADGHVLWHQQFAAAVQREWEAQARPPLLSLREADQREGDETLAQLGLPAGAWFVCFHVREPGFWWKWNRVHAATRDADILTYTPAMQAVVERGGWVIRMGDATMKKLPSMPGVVDYAHSGVKSEKMDVFLSARCRFFVGVNSGLSLLPPTFGRPCVLTNFIPLSVPLPYAGDIIVPKLLRTRTEDRFLTFDELFETGLADAQFVKCMPQGVEVVDNRPDELREAVLEMLDEVEGGLTAGELPEVRELRSRYDRMVLRHGGFLGSRLSGSFLLRYRDLL